MIQKGKRVPHATSLNSIYLGWEEEKLLLEVSTTSSKWCNCSPMEYIFVFYKISVFMPITNYLHLQDFFCWFQYLRTMFFILPLFKLCKHIDTLITYFLTINFFLNFPVYLNFVFCQYCKTTVTQYLICHLQKHQPNY